MPSLRNLYDAALSEGALKPDGPQARAVAQLAGLTEALNFRSGWFTRKATPKGLYIWGDVGRGKSMLMDLFFEAAPLERKTRVHFNAFMTDVHARIHALREAGGGDPISVVAREIAAHSQLLCFDEFQVGDVADAMILGRLYEALFALDVVVVATSNTPPSRLYEGGLNRQLFLPFIAELEARLDVLHLDGATDYRLERIAGLDMYLTPLGANADARMDKAWRRLTDMPHGKPVIIHLLGRELKVPEAAHGVARFTFAQLCEAPLAAADYLAIARQFHTVLLDHVPMLDASKRNEARRFMLLVDTLYDEGVKLICSAAAPPDALYPLGDGAEAFRRAASRLQEMQSQDYLARGHGVHAQ